MADVEIGRGKTGRRAYTLDEIGIVPARRTRDPEEVSIAWQIDAYRFDLPLVACPMDSVVSPATAITIGKLGGLAVLDLEGLWTRFEDPEPLLREVAELGEEAATRRLQEIYAEPIKEELIGRRIEEISRAGVVTAAALSPQRTARYYKAVLDAGADIFVIRGTTVSAEHVSGRAEPLPRSRRPWDLESSPADNSPGPHQSPAGPRRPLPASGVCHPFGFALAAPRPVAGVTRIRPRLHFVNY